MHITKPLAAQPGVIYNAFAERYFSKGVLLSIYGNINQLCHLKLVVTVACLRYDCILYENLLFEHFVLFEW